MSTILIKIRISNKIKCEFLVKTTNFSLACHSTSSRKGGLMILFPDKNFKKVFIRKQYDPKPRKSQEGRRNFLPGAVCQKSLAEFAPRRARRLMIHFSGGMYAGEIHLGPQVCELSAIGGQRVRAGGRSFLEKVAKPLFRHAGTAPECCHSGAVFSIPAVDLRGLLMAG